MIHQCYGIAEAKVAHDRLQALRKLRGTHVRTTISSKLLDLGIVSRLLAAKLVAREACINSAVTYADNVKHQSIVLLMSEACQTRVLGLWLPKTTKP